MKKKKSYSHNFQKCANMENNRLISLQHIIDHYEIDRGFIDALTEHGLVEIVRIEEQECIDEDCLADVERMMRLHFDLEINMAGIEAISHLLNRVHEMQKEMIVLRNKIHTGI